jgi:Pyruvate/2-oxoacid:ferredoxin oxidoreductase gamma subunit/Pyruvate/2-oxoacid:ferredoxin oxidoreductase delta subunit
MENKNSLVKILFSGEGGQGIQVMANIFAHALNEQKYKVVLMPHYGVEQRMGISLAYLQVGEEEASYPKFKQADILIALTPRDLKLTKSFVAWGTTVINAMNLEAVLKENELPRKSLNMLTLGVLCREFKKKLPLDTGKIKEEIKIFLGEKKYLEKNLDAFMLGINLSEKLYNKALDAHPHNDLSPTVTRSKEKDYYHFSSHCKGCGLCIEKCPVKALSWSKEKINYFGAPVPQVDIQKCIACKICEQLCPDMAIKVDKKR